jgi:DNA uptake protein ComE-like DNA-binding protein
MTRRVGSQNPFQPDTQAELQTGRSGPSTVTQPTRHRRSNHVPSTSSPPCFAALALNAFAAVDVNQASQAELETVKGIGPGLSSKILDARKASSFKDWTDFVERVSGIGPATPTASRRPG